MPATLNVHEHTVSLPLSPKQVNIYMCSQRILSTTSIPFILQITMRFSVALLALAVAATVTVASPVPGKGDHPSTKYPCTGSIEVFSHNKQSGEFYNNLVRLLAHRSFLGLVQSGSNNGYHASGSNAGYNADADKAAKDATKQAEQAQQQ